MAEKIPRQLGNSILLVAASLFTAAKAANPCKTLGGGHPNEYSGGCLIKGCAHKWAKTQSWLP
jgi:hypothetical protein